MQTSIKYDSADATNPLSQFVQSCLQQYEDKQGSQNQYSEYDDDNLSQDFFVNQQEQVKYYGYEDKKSITIKPVRMHKDLISLRKQNEEKKLIISKLEKQNIQLKQKYNLCMMQNKKVQQFLKDIEFTFKNDRRSQKANEVMMKTKKMLYRQAQDCQFSAKKLTRSQQAGKVQQLKLYIEFMQKEKIRLKGIIQEKKRKNEKLHEEQDFTAQNEEKFQETLQRVQEWLNVEMLRVKRRQEIYLVQKGMVSTGLKQKEIMLKKKSIQKYYDKLKDLLLQKQGEQYEIEVLQKKRKDKLKLIEELKQFKSDIMSKKSSIQQLEKQLKQKLKTYQYMTKWTKQLKSRLQQKKQNHINNKILYEKKISALSKEFEELNKKYKMELAEQQQGGVIGNGTNGWKKTVGTRQFGQGRQYAGKQRQTFQKNTQTLGRKIKMIKLEQISKIVKRIRIWILSKQLNPQQLIKQTFLKWNEPFQLSQQNEVQPITRKKQNKHQTLQLQSQNSRKKLVKKSLHPNWASNKKSFQDENVNNNIKLSQLIQNIKTWMKMDGIAYQKEEDAINLARYVVQDGQQPAKQEPLNQKNLLKTPDGLVPDLSVPKSLALTIMKKLFENELHTFEQIEDTKQKLKQFLIKNYDPFRLDLLKILLSMGGLQLLNKNKALQNGMLSVTQYLTGQRQIGSSQMTTMKKNQQLHLQLDLDQPIFLSRLKKHVIAQFYVARFKELIDLMIFQEFGQIERPRLGMFDRVCEIILGKKLIKENVTRQYNFDCIPTGQDGEILSKEVKTDKSDRQKQTEKLSNTLRQKNYVNTQKISRPKILDKKQQDEQESYWIVGRQGDKKNSQVNINLDDEEQNGWQIPQKKSIKEKKKKTWLDDLMSDNDDEDNGMQGHFDESQQQNDF